VAGRIIRTGLWNLGCWTFRRTRTLELCKRDRVAGLLDEPGLWNYVSGVAGRIIRTGLWNLGCRTNNTNRTLEFRLPDLDEPGLWNYVSGVKRGCRLLDEPSSTNFHKLWDFGIMLSDFWMNLDLKLYA
ncbi:hypothetical protein RhiirA5_437477, partial [Rhizophagus irregularis]